MSELPKFKLHSYEIVDFNTKNEHVWMDTWDVEREDNRDFIYLEDYKSQLALWDKYKDNPQLFFKDFPKQQKDNSISNIRMSVEMKWIDCKVNNMDFKDWLFDKLFKDGIV